MKAQGFDVDSVYWSGFWSQGDGACFTGRVDNFNLFFAHYKLPVDHIQWVRERDGLEGIFSVYSAGSYCHSYTMQTNNWPYIVDFDQWYRDGSIDDPMVKAAVAHKVRLAETQLEELEELFLSALRDEADELYKELEQEYEHQTDDEQVLESLIANLAIEDEVADYEEENRDDCDDDEAGDEADASAEQPSERGSSQAPDEGPHPAAAQPPVLRPVGAVLAPG